LTIWTTEVDFFERVQNAWMKSAAATSPTVREDQVHFPT